MNAPVKNLLPETAAEIPEEPRFPEKELTAFCAYHFNRRERYLRAIQEGRQAPLYLLDHATLRTRAQQFRAVFTKLLPDIAIYYAVKSNNHPEVAKTLLYEGLGLDVSSGLELKMALDSGCREIIFSGPGKTNEELNLALIHSEKTTVLIDSFGELKRLDKLARKSERIIRAGVRLTTRGNPLWRKFGIPAELLPEFWRSSETCKQVNLQGLQFHSSWNLNPGRQIEFIRDLGHQLEEMPEAFVKALKFIDLGGGFWPEQGEWLQPQGTRLGTLDKARGEERKAPLEHYRLPTLPLRAFAEQLAQALEENIFTKIRCRICFEPGRWLCNDAMHLLLTVIDKKAYDLVITDAGTNTVGWERFESDYFPILNLSRPALKEQPCDIMGSLCTPHDIWGYSYWGESLEEGDILMIPTQGAYTYSLRQNFIKAPAKVVSL